MRFQFEITLRHGCSPVNLLHIVRTPLPYKTSGWLLLKNRYEIPFYPAILEKLISLIYSGNQQFSNLPLNLEFIS